MYFLDYHEGRLGPGQVAELFIFLDTFPELKEEFDEFENIPVTPDMSISFTGKGSLKKNNVSGFGPINASNYENYFIADTEKQLMPEEQRWLRGFLEINPELAAVYSLYLGTRLQPDMQIHFPGKAGLKRSIFNTRRVYYYAVSAAASIALLFAVFLNSGIKQETGIAYRQKPLNIPVPGNSTQSRAVAHQRIPVPAAATQPVSAGNTSFANQLADQVVVGNNQQYDERKPLAEIQARLEARITSRDVVAPEYIFIRHNRDNPQLYTILYDQINLAERMQNEQVLTPVASSPKSLFNSALVKLGSIFTGRETPSNHGTFNFWTLADLGISGYNLLTDKDLKLLTQSNDSGKVVSYALSGDEFEFIRQQNKQKKP